jgi:hypothetical protein
LPRRLSVVRAHKDRHPYELVPLFVEATLFTAYHSPSYTWIGCFDGKQNISEAQIKLFRSYSFLSFFSHTTLHALYILILFRSIHIFSLLPLFFIFFFLCHVLCSFLCCLSSFYFILVPCFFLSLPSSIYFSSTSCCTYFICVPAHSFHIRERNVSPRTIPYNIARHNISREQATINI